MPYVNSTVRAALFAAATTATTAAFATAPGERVENTVTVTFEVGSVAQDPGTAEVGFVVDRKIDMLVADTGSIVNGRPKQEGRTLVYKVTNEGNDDQPYDIDVSLTGNLATKIAIDTNSDTLGPSEYRVYISTDATIANGTVYDPAPTTIAATPVAYDDGLTTNDEFFVIIAVNIPSDAADTETVTFHVKATALKDDGSGPLLEVTGRGLDNEADPLLAVDIVYADGAKTTDSTGADVTEDGKHTDNASLTVASAELTVTKAVKIVSENTQNDFTCATDNDPGLDDNTEGAIPGACLEYTITVKNGAAASESATTVTIVDDLPAGVSFEAFFDKTDWPNATYDVPLNQVEASLPTVAKGDVKSLVFRVVVD